MHAVITGQRPPGARPRAGLALLALAQLIISVDFNIVYVALPEIGRGLGFTALSLQWVVSAYAVGYGGFLLLGGRAADRLGQRRVFVAGLALFGLASLLGGLAVAPGLLVAARVGQGLGAALLFPATLALISTSFAEGPERNRALALWGVAGASGAVAGPLVGGVLTSALGWEWVFFVNVPLALGAAAAAPRLLPAAAPSGRGLRGFDLPGAALATAGATLVVLGLTGGPEAGWASARGAGSLAAGVALLGAFAFVEHRTRDPLMPLRMLGNRSLAAAVALVFVFMGTINTLHYAFFVYVQDVLGLSAFQAGLAFLPQSLLAVAGSWGLLPTLLNRWGARATLAGGMLGSGAAMAVVAAGMAARGPYWVLLPGAALMGLSAGIGYPAVFAAAGAGVPPGQQGVASALTSTSQQVGGAVGLAALLAAASAGLGSGAPAGVASGLLTATWLAAAVTAASAGLALTRKRA